MIDFEDIWQKLNSYEIALSCQFRSSSIWRRMEGKGMDVPPTSNCWIRHWVQPWALECRMSKITNDGLTRSGTGCFMVIPIWQQWASKG